MVGKLRSQLHPYPCPSSPHSKETCIYQDRAAADLLSLRTWGGIYFLGQGGVVFYLQTVGCLSKEEVTEKRDRGPLQGRVRALAILLMAFWDGFVEQALTQKLLWFYPCLAMSVLSDPPSHGFSLQNMLVDPISHAQSHVLSFSPIRSTTYQTVSSGHTSPNLSKAHDPSSKMLHRPGW